MSAGESPRGGPGGRASPTTQFPRPTKWRDAIPWVLDLDEGIRLAKAEQRPLLLWTSGDDPLERC